MATGSNNQWRRGAARVAVLVAVCLLGGMAAIARPASPSLSPRPVAASPAPSPPDEAIARRIVSLAPNLTEMLFAIGAGDAVAGVTDYCDYPPEARTRPKVGGFVNPNPEAVLALAPDCIVATPNVGNRPFVERMMRSGARVVVVEARTLDEIFPALETLGRVSGHAAGAAAVASRIRSALEATRRRIAGLPRPATLLCIQREPLIVAGPGSYPHDLLLLAGGRSIVPDTLGPYPTLSLEQVIEAAPDVVIQTRMDASADAGEDGAIRRWWGRWPSLPAVRSGRVHLVPGDTILRPGPRVVEGLDLLVTLLHPDARPERR